jgi:hypothetical protein
MVASDAGTESGVNGVGEFGDVGAQFGASLGGDEQGVLK